jgi:hypothetical protein
MAGLSFKKTGKPCAPKQKTTVILKDLCYIFFNGALLIVMLLF